MTDLPALREAYIDIVFDGPPAPESGRFVEVEDADKRSISIGEWIPDGDLWRLRMRDPRPLPALLDELEMLHADLAALKGILHAAHGVLTDAATIAVPGAYDDPLAPAVQQLVDERDAYRAALTKVATVELDALETADHLREPTKKGGKRSDKEQL